MLIFKYIPQINIPILSLLVQLCDYTHQLFGVGSQKMLIGMFLVFHLFLDPIKQWLLDGWTQPYSCSCFRLLGGLVDPVGKDLEGTLYLALLFVMQLLLNCLFVLTVELQCS